MSKIKFMSLDLLQIIKANNYLGANGHDYEPSEIEDQIYLKQSRLDAKRLKQLERESLDERIRLST